MRRSFVRSPRARGEEERFVASTSEAQYDARSEKTLDTPARAIDR
jgi:hypothetical protein